MSSVSRKLAPSSPIELIETPVEIVVTRSGRRVMSHVFQHTPIRLGRILDNDVILPFDGISRHHCELRFVNSQWTVVDLQSLNGVLIGERKVTSAALEKNGEFEITPVLIQFRVLKSAAAAIGETSEATLGAALEATLSQVSSSEGTVVGDDPQSVSAKRLHAERPRAQARRETSEEFFQRSLKRAVLEANGVTLMGDVHPQIETSKSMAVQVTVMWHEVLMSVDEFLPGEAMIVDISGAQFLLGQVGKERSEIRSPKGTTFLDRPGNESMLLPSAPATWMGQSGLQILARYVPRSRSLQTGIKSIFDSDLVDPLMISGVVHGALALATATITVGNSADRKIPVERIARIIASVPLSGPLPVPLKPVSQLAKPTPKPQPVPAATPVPTPGPIPPRSAIKKTKAPTPVTRATPVAKSVLDSPIKSAPKRETKVERVIPPTPTPKPFDAASVGALKMLTMLRGSKSEPLPNAKQIVVRKTANVDAPVSNGPSNAAKSTGDMMATLPKADHGSPGVGGLSLPMAVGKDGYGTAGYSNRTGKRNVMGSVIGGATFTEIARTEGLSRDQVMKVVQNHQSQIQQCYERALMGDSNLAGRAEFEWEIMSTGTVTAASVTVKDTNLKNADALLSCVKDIFRKMVFPKAKNGSTTTPTIGLPFGRL